MGRLLLRVSAVALLLMGVAGCRGGDIDVTVRGNGSGVVVAELFPANEVLAQLDAVDLEALVADSVPSDADLKFEEIDDRGRRGYRIEIGFDDDADLPGVLVHGVGVLGQQVQLLSSFDLRELEGEWHLDAVVNPVTSMTGEPAADGFSAQVDAVLQSAARVTGRRGVKLSIALPGQVVSSNADEVDGGTATWNLTELSAPTRLTMRTEPKEFPTPAQLVVAGGAALIVLGVVLWVVGATRRTKVAPRRRRHRRWGRRRKEVAQAEWGPPPVPRPIGLDVPDTGDRSPSDRAEALPPLAMAASPASAPHQPPFGAASATVPPQPVPPQPVPPQPVPPSPVPPSPEPVPPAPVPPAPEPPAPEPPGPPPVPPSPFPEPPGPIPPTPVNEPPTPAAVTPEPGWYPDPADAARVRWWNGSAWTEHVN